MGAGADRAVERDRLLAWWCYLAALQDIPPELVEAASIDGARRWGVLRHVVLPALHPVTIFLIVWQTFESLQLFDLVFVTTRGGPLQSTTVVVLYVWQQAFEFFNAGYGAAAAYVLAFGLLVVALAWGWYQRRRQARLRMRRRPSPGISCWRRWR